MAKETKSQATERISTSQKERNLWQIILIEIILGIVLVTSCASQAIVWKGAIGTQNLYSFLDAWGSLMLVACACYFAGGLTGFLFGIPKMTPNSSTPEVKPATETSKETKKRVINQNDNLVQISDWITKIIVGVGLTQLYNIDTYLLKVGNYLSHSVNADPIKGRNVAIVTILYFSIIGFLSVYLWTRLYFTKMLNDLETDLDEVTSRVRSEMQDVLNKNQENTVGTGGGKTSSSDREGAAVPVPNTNQENISVTGIGETIGDPEGVTISIPENPKIIDPQKNKWGGLSMANGRKIDAVVSSAEDPDLFLVTITVSSTDSAKPLSGYVYFHLHHTFANPHPVIAVQNNVAVLRLNRVWGAFTVGAETDDGTKLELDLAELPGAPQKFRDR